MNRHVAALDSRIEALVAALGPPAPSASAAAAAPSRASRQEAVDLTSPVATPPLEENGDDLDPGFRPTPYYQWYGVRGTGMIFRTVKRTIAYLELHPISHDGSLLSVDCTFVFHCQWITN